MIDYQLEPALAVDEFIDVLRRSTLAERRPVDDRRAMAGMLAQADVIVTARLAGLLVGVARALTDFSYCAYLSDLAVARDQQRQGIGQQLLRRAHEAAGLHTTLILLSAPAAQSYYQHIGLNLHPSAWTIRPQTAAAEAPDPPPGRSSGPA